MPLQIIKTGLQEVSHDARLEKIVRERDETPQHPFDGIQPEDEDDDARERRYRIALGSASGDGVEKSFVKKRDNGLNRHAGSGRRQHAQKKRAIRLRMPHENRQRLPGDGLHITSIQFTAQTHKA